MAERAKAAARMRLPLQAVHGIAESADEQPPVAGRAPAKPMDTAQHVAAGQAESVSRQQASMRWAVYVKIFCRLF